MNGRCYLRAVRPRWEDRGPVAGVVVTFPDITSLKRAQTALGESEARFRRMFTNNMVPMALCTKSGATVDANHVFLDLFGYTRSRGFGRAGRPPNAAGCCAREYPESVRNRVSV